MLLLPPLRPGQLHGSESRRSEAPETRIISSLAQAVGWLTRTWSASVSTVLICFDALQFGKDFCSVGNSRACFCRESEGTAGGGGWCLSQARSFQ